MKALQGIVLVVAVVLLMASPVLAQEPHGTFLFSGGAIGAGLGAGLTIIGAGIGFGRIGSAALESMARQPEVAGRVFAPMIVVAAMFEGAVLFAVFVCLQILNKQSF